MLTRLQMTISQFIFRTQYRKEILTIITIKLLAILLLWQMFFSNPIDHKLTKNELVEHFVTLQSTN